jgi:ribosome-associated protein
MLLDDNIDKNGSRRLLPASYLGLVGIILSPSASHLRLMQPHRAPRANPMKNQNLPLASANEFDDERPSKTQMKKASHELQSLGEDLVGLPDSRIDALELSETLLQAVREYRRTRSHEGRRRQMQFIGKLMRHTDAEPIRQAVAAMKLGVARNALELHEAERWRAELIASDDALTRWMAEFPSTDAQQLRSVVRAARKDAALVPEKRSGRAYRELFQLIKQYQAGSGTTQEETVDE